MLSQTSKRWVWALKWFLSVCIWMNVRVSVTADDYLRIDKSQQGHSWEHRGQTAVFMVPPRCHHCYYYHASHLYLFIMEPTASPFTAVFSLPSTSSLLWAHLAACRTSDVCRSLPADGVWASGRCDASCLNRLSVINVNIQQKHPSVFLPPRQINIRRSERKK